MKDSKAFDKALASKTFEDNPYKHLAQLPLTLREINKFENKAVARELFTIRKDVQQVSKLYARKLTKIMKTQKVPQNVQKFAALTASDLGNFGQVSKPAVQTTLKRFDDLKSIIVSDAAFRARIHDAVNAEPKPARRKPLPNNSNASPKATLPSNIEDILLTQKGRGSKVLSAVPIAMVPKVARSNRQVKIKHLETCGMERSSGALRKLKNNEKAAALGTPRHVEVALGKFGYKADDSDFVIAAAMDVVVKFMTKGVESKKITGYRANEHKNRHTSYNTVNGTDVVTIKCKGGERLHLWMPSSDKDLSVEFRDKVKTITSVANCTAYVPDVDLKHLFESDKFVDCRATHPEMGDLHSTGIKLFTHFELNAEGARARQVAAMNMAKTAVKRTKPKIIIFNKPFCAMIERDREEVFCAKIAKADWIKRK